jgi:hypothetical protein
MSEVDAFPLASVGLALALWVPRVKSSCFPAIPMGAPLVSRRVPERPTLSEYWTLAPPVYVVEVDFADTDVQCFCAVAV